MPNILSTYDPQFYANEALIQLEKALGMAARVYRGFDEERRAYGRGSVINVRKPSTFTAQDAPSTAQDINAGNVAVTLDQWKEVKFKLTDKELTYTGERIVQEHIRPAAYAIADAIDQALSALYKDIPWFVDLQSTTAVRDITDVRQVLFDLGVPMNDLHYQINGTLENAFLQLAAFSQWQGAGSAGVETQLRGSLGMKFGVEVFANQNTPSHTPGVAADATGAVNNGAGYAAGTTTIAIDGVTNAGTFKKGDTFVIAGNTQRYAITADATADGLGNATLSFTPGLAAAVADNAVVTISLDTHVANLMFHRNAFCLATAPLSTMASELGVKMAIAQDPVTGLSIRSRIYAIPDSSVVAVALDVLYGVKTLDPNLACRGRG